MRFAKNELRQCRSPKGVAEFADRFLYGANASNASSGKDVYMTFYSEDAVMFAEIEANAGEPPAE